MPGHPTKQMAADLHGAIDPDVDPDSPVRPERLVACQPASCRHIQ